MSHILRTTEKKSTRSAINTLVSRELRFGGYPSRRSRITTAPAGEIEQAAGSHHQQQAAGEVHQKHSAENTIKLSVKLEFKKYEDFRKKKFMVWAMMNGPIGYLCIILCEQWMIYKL